MMITSKLLPNTLVSFAGADPRMLITSDSPKAGHSVERSVMRLPSPCVEATIARSITAAMKPRGGGTPGLIRPAVPARCGWTRIRWLLTKCLRWLPSARYRHGRSTPHRAPVGTDKRSAKRDRPVDKGDPNYKTKPIIAADPSSALSKRTRGI